MKDFSAAAATLELVCDNSTTSKLSEGTAFTIVVLAFALKS